MRSYATAYDPFAILLQPLDPSCRRQSVRRGFAISLPVLIIYHFLYLLNFVPQESKIYQQHKSIVARFWSYHRHEAFQNVASLDTYVMSQFIHDGLIRLVIDSLILIGVASILGSVFNLRTFFAVYVLGGFLAATADCAWAQITKPCRNFSRAQCDEASTSASLINDASAEIARLSASSRVYTIRGFGKLLINSEDFEELKRQCKVVETYCPQVKDWDRWSKQIWAASGSLVCLCMPTTRRGVCSFSLPCNQTLLRY